MNFSYQNIRVIWVIFVNSCHAFRWEQIWSNKIEKIHVTLWLKTLSKIQRYAPKIAIFYCDWKHPSEAQMDVDSFKGPDFIKPIHLKEAFYSDGHIQKNGFGQDNPLFSYADESKAQRKKKSPFRSSRPTMVFWDYSAPRWHKLRAG